MKKSLLITMTGLTLSLASCLSLAADSSNQSTESDSVMTKGEYLTRAADCSVCHTAKGGEEYAGGLSFKTPFGTMFSSNITPDDEYGIGKWTEQDFINAVKHGKRPDGSNLYPSMPYTSYVNLSDDDAKAIFAYLKTLKPVHKAPPENIMGFPYNQRWTLSFWNMLNFKDTPFTPDPTKDDEYNRGAYVESALGHCEECHTPRDLTMGLKSGLRFAGAQVDGWTAYNISPSNTAGIGTWSVDDIVQYLSTGSVPGKATAAGPMAEVISHSTRYMTHDDLKALAVYLKAQEPKGDESTPNRSTQGQAINEIDTQVRGFDAGDKPSGAILFSTNCAACHGQSAQGNGENNYYPSLFHNSTVGASDPSNLIQVILHGVDRTDGQGRHIVMGGFADQMTSSEIATLTNYITHNFGNRSVKVTAADVDKAKTNEVTVIPGWMLILGGVIGALIVLGLIYWFVQRRKK